MILNSVVEDFVKIGEILRAGNDELEDVLTKTEQHNPWFKRFHSRLMLQSFIDHFFDAGQLEKWLAPYQQRGGAGKKIGLVFAGNVPFVGMHDLLCVLMCEHRATVKLSSKDQYFFPWLKKTLSAINPAYEQRIEFTDRLEKFDAVIATGSRNSARYFEYYFGKYPHIIRRNRTSIAILSGNESEEDLLELGKDVFYYYGLGCRNVSKIYMPATVEPEQLFRIWEAYRYVEENTKYKNNYDYNRAILLLNQTPHLANDFFMMVEDERIFSPLSTLYYEYYNSEAELHEKINTITADLQCVVSAGEGNTPFGQTQFPNLWDYADHLDTMDFLLAI